MAYKYIIPFGQKDDDDRLTPSQRAREEQKTKLKYIKPYEPPKIEVVTPEKKPIEPVKKPGFIEKAVKGVKEFLFGKKEITPQLPVPEGLTEDQYISLVGTVRMDKREAEQDLEETQYELEQLRKTLPFVRPAREDKEETRLEDRVFALKKTVGYYDNLLTRETSRRGVFKTIFEKTKEQVGLRRWEEIQSTKEEVKVIEKYESGEELTSDEQVYLNKHRARTIDSYVERGLADNVGEVIANMPVYMMEMYVTNQLTAPVGTYQIIAGAARNILKLTPSTANSIVNKVLTKSVKNAVASIYAFPTIEEKTADYMLPNYQLQFDSEGQDYLKLVKPGFDEEAAVSKAYASNMVEYVSETVGDYIDDALPFVKKLFISKWLRNRGVTTGGAVRGFLNKVHFNSIVGEVLEEEIGEPLQAMIDEREYKDPFFTPEGRERLLVEILGIAGFSGIARVSDITERGIRDRRKKVPNDKIVLNVGEAEVKEEPPRIVPIEEAEPGARVGVEVEAKPAEEAGEKFDFSSTQLTLPESQSKEIVELSRKIPEEELYTEEGERGFGREEEPHVTVLFGLKPDALDEVSEIVRQEKPIEIELGEVSIFDTNEDYDVVKADIEGEDLKALNKKLNDALETPGQEFEEYRPHITIAYVKKGEGVKYVGDQTLKGKKIVLTELSFMDTSGKPTIIPLEGKKVAVKAEPEVELKKEVKPVKKVKKVPKKAVPTKKRIKVPKKVVKKKPKVFKPVEVVRPKKKVLVAKERKAVQKEVREVIRTSKDPETIASGIDTYMKKINQDADSPLYVKRLKAIRAELRKSMYEIAGIATGNWKTDYAYLQSVRHDSQLSEVINVMEEQIFEIDEKVDKQAPAGAGFATTGSQPIGTFEDRAPPKKGSSEFKLYEQTVKLIRKYAHTIGEKYTPRGALGVYYGDTKNIRVNSINNLSTVAHEITHFLDFVYHISDALMAVTGYSKDGKPAYDPATLKYRKAITEVYLKYYPTGRKGHKLRKRTLEGFATLLQKYVESPKKIEAEFPLLVKAFLKPGGRYYKPIMGEIIQDLNTIVEGYQGLSALDKIGARITSDFPEVSKGSFLKFHDRVRTQLADELYPIEVLAKKSKRHFTVQDPSLWLRAYNAISGIINNNIATNRGFWRLKGNEFVRTLKFNWKTLVDSLQQRKNTDDFAFYLVARREHFSYQELDELKREKERREKEFKQMKKAKEDLTLKNAEGKTIKDEVIETRNEYTELKAILDRDGLTRSEVDEAYMQNKSRFVKEEKMFDALTKQDVETMADAGLLTPQKEKELLSTQGYASFKRQFYDEILGDFNELPSQAMVGKTKVSSLIRRKGSERTIINPVFSGMLNHSEIARKSMRQVVYNRMADIGTSAVFPKLFQKLDVVTAVDPKTGAIFYPQDKDPNIIMGRDSSGKRVPVLADREIKSILDNLLTYKNVDVFEKVYIGLSRLFTAGTTGLYPQFAATNFVVDQITGSVNTANKYRGILTPLAQFGKILKNRNSIDYKYYQEYLVMGGERQTFTGWQSMPPKELFKRVSREKKGLEKAMELVDKGVDIWSTPSKYSELVSRASEYIAARKAGKPQIVALEEAGRVTAPFHHAGKWGGRFGKSLVRGLPFFNASLQVLDQSVRTLETKGGRQRTVVMLSIITASYLASLLALLRADDDQKEQYKDIEARELTNFLYFPNPAGKNLIRVRMSETFSPFGTILNMIIADHYLKTNYKASDYYSAATANIPDQFNLLDPVRVFFSWVPQVFKAGFETAAGVKTYPRVIPLESMALKNSVPANRFNENTSLFAKFLGKRLNLSPIKIDHLITGYFGRWTGVLTGKPTAWDFKSSVIRDYWFSYGRRVSGAYDLKKINDEQYGDYQKGLIEVDDEKELYRVKILTQDFSDLMKDYRDIDIEEQPDEARDLRNEALKILNMIETGEEPRGFSKWTRGAKKRRKKNLKEKVSLLPEVDKPGGFKLVKVAHAAEGLTGREVDQTRWRKIAENYREKYPEWYSKNVGEQGEINMFGKTISDWPISTKKKILPSSKKAERAFAGVKERKPPKEYADVIITSSKKSKVDSSLVAAILIQESGYNSKAVNDGGASGVDRGIAQINSKAHPEVSDEQAYDPDWAIAWLARQLKSDIEHFGDINRGLAAYNVGRGGANVKGKEKFGGGPKGQTYIDNVARNLTEEQRKKLGLKTTY